MAKKELTSNVKVITSGSVPTTGTLPDKHLAFGVVGGKPKIYGNSNGTILDYNEVQPATIPDATRTARGAVMETSPDGVGTTSLGTSSFTGSRAISFNAPGSTAQNFNNYRTTGEWWFYVSSATNAPPFTTGSGSGYYLKVMMLYSNTHCVQMCWRRESSEVWTRYSTSATAWSVWEQLGAGAGSQGEQGWGFYSTTVAVSNISSISGMRIGDYIVNGNSATLTILGQSTPVGSIVKATTATAGTIVGNIRGATGTNGTNGSNGLSTRFYNASQTSTGTVTFTAGTFVPTITASAIQAGDMAITSNGYLYRFATTGSLTGTYVRSLNGIDGTVGAKGISFYATTTAVSNISSISGMTIGDYIINTGSSTITILGQSTVIGGVVRSTSATAGTASGNIRGPEGTGGGTSTPYVTTASSWSGSAGNYTYSLAAATHGKGTTPQVTCLESSTRQVINVKTVISAAGLITLTSRSNASIIVEVR